MCIQIYGHKKTGILLESRHTQNTHEPFLSSPAQEFVPEVGLEPTYRKALDPKSSASTNFATRAYYLLERDLLLYNEAEGKFQFPSHPQYTVQLQSEHLTSFIPPACLTAT